MHSEKEKYACEPGHTSASIFKTSLLFDQVHISKFGRFMISESEKLFGTELTGSFFFA